MRRTIALAVCAVLAGCHGDDVAPPQLQRPIETLPAGARVVVLGSDLANTWQRIEAHDLRAAVESIPGTAPVFRAPALARMMDMCREFEAATGTSLEQDLVLNVIGGRAGVGIYPRSADAVGHPDHDGEPLLVAELRDPERFRAAMSALVERPVGHVRVEPSTFDGDTAWRLSGDDETVVHVVLRDAFLVATPRDDLARAARELHGGRGATAIGDPALSAALGAVGSHNLTVLVRDGAIDDSEWMGHGFTWTTDGLHFDHASAFEEGELAGIPAPTQTGRDAILKSLPDGLTLAAYVHRSVAGAHDARGSSGGGSAFHAAGNGPPFALPFFANPPAWCGDEIGIALRGVEPTALAPVPDVAFVLTVRDAAAAETELRALESRLAQLPVGPAARGFVDVEYGGRTFRTLEQPLAENVSPSWMLDGDVAVVATTRALMQQIVDTRRTGRRSAHDDKSFRAFREFVPKDAGAVVYADQKRLRRVAQELERSASMWGPKVEQGVLTLGRVSAILEHFPAGAAYATLADDRIAVRGWMLEAN